MNWQIWLLNLLLLPLILSGKSLLAPDGNAVPLTLAENGKTEYKIIYSASHKADKAAAEKLAFYLGQLSGGAVFPLFADPASCQEPFISIGKTSAANSLGAGADFLPQQDEIEILLSGRNLFLSASDNILNAVMALLENDLGCRFFTPDITYLPVQREGLNVRIAARREKAAFRDRLLLTDYALVMNSDWFRLNRVLNWEHFHHPRDWFCHTYHNIVPMTDFAKTPELFAQVNGKPEPVMICPTHPENLRRVGVMIPEAMRKNPGKRYFSVAQSDGAYSCCKCERCLKIIRDYGDAPMAAHLQLVNAAARAAAEYAPEQLVEFIVYSENMRKPPKNLLLEDNVHIWFCANFLKNLPITGQQEKMQEFLTWRRQARTMAIWEYGPNFNNYMSIVSSFLPQCRNLQFYRQHAISGIMMQEVTGVRGGDLQYLRAWVFAKLLWNPLLDADQLALEYCQGVYGPAADIMYGYYNFVQQPAREGNTFDQYYSGRLPELLASTESEFDRALTLAGVSPAAIKQVEIDSLPVRIALLDRLFDSYPENRSSFPFEEYRRRLDSVKQIVSKHDIPLISETRSMNGYISEREILANMEKHSGIFEIFAVDGRLYSYPRANDALAEGGKVTRQKTDNNWLVQWPLPMKLLEMGKKYQLSAEIRLEKASEYPEACGAGCYDTTAKKGIFYAFVPGTALSDREYRYVDIGMPFSLPEKHDVYIYFSAPAASDVGSFFVNRIRLTPAE